MRLIAPLLGGTAIAVASLLLWPSTPPAFASGGTAKFAVQDYRITMDGEETGGALPMVIRGKAAAHGNEYLPFRWRVPDGRPYLPILQTCAAGGLNGQVRLAEDRDDRPIDGEGPLLEISCQVDMK